MPTRAVFRCQFCDAVPDHGTQRSLAGQVSERMFGEYLDAFPGRWLVWNGGGPLGPRRYACREHRGDLVAYLRYHYATVAAQVWKMPPYQQRWPDEKRPRMGGSMGIIKFGLRGGLLQDRPPAGPEADPPGAGPAADRSTPAKDGPAVGGLPTKGAAGPQDPRARQPPAGPPAGAPGETPDPPGPPADEELFPPGELLGPGEELEELFGPSEELFGPSEELFGPDELVEPDEELFPPGELFLPTDGPFATGGGPAPEDSADDDDENQDDSPWPPDPEAPPA
ncbi:MAG TPA: hypothetical protein VIJ51_05410 [Solirubrobacteraceae bacterium]